MLKEPIMQNNMLKLLAKKEGNSKLLEEYYQKAEEV